MDTRPVTENQFLRRLSREFEWFFDRFGFDRPMFETDTAIWTPYIEVLEQANEFVVRAELPGLRTEEIKVEITGRELTIFGERGSFLRTIALPEGVNVEKTVATMKGGVLEVKMPLAKVDVLRRRLEIAEEVTAEKAVKTAA
jgi:HSP20 family protein